MRRSVVSIELSAPNSVLEAGTTTQLTVIGRDARQQPIDGWTGVTFATSNGFNIIVSASGQPLAERA